MLAFSSFTGEVTGVVNTGERAYAAYDSVADVVLASVKPTGAQVRRLMIYRHGSGGFTQVGEQELPAFGQGPPQPTPFGFINTGNAGDAAADPVHHRKLLVWDRQMPGRR